MKHSPEPLQISSSLSFSSKLNSQSKRRNHLVRPLESFQLLLNELTLKTQHFLAFLNNFWNPDSLQQPIQFGQGLVVVQLSKKQLQELHSFLINKIKQRKKLKINWSCIELQLMLTMAVLIAFNLSIQIDSLTQENWEQVSQCLPGRSGNDCRFKYLSLEKVVVKDFKWSEKQDQILKQLVQDPEDTDWTQISKQLYNLNENEGKLYRSGKQCREHYFCYLDPYLKKGAWTKQEDKQLINLYKSIGRKWYQMTKSLKGRNENSIKNRFAILCKRFDEENEELAALKIRNARLKRSPKAKQPDRKERSIQSRLEKSKNERQERLMRRQDKRNEKIFSIQALLQENQGVKENQANKSKRQLSLLELDVIQMFESINLSVNTLLECDPSPIPSLEWIQSQLSRDDWTVIPFFGSGRRLGSNLSLQGQLYLQ